MAKVKDKIAEEVLKLLDHLEKIRAPYESTYKDVAENVIPILEDWELKLPEGQRLGTKIYDGTPINALQLFADGLHGYTISPATIWFRLTLEVPIQSLMERRHPGAMTTGPLRPYISRYETLEDVPEVRAWLQETGKSLYRAFQRSNFYSSMTPLFEIGGSTGTATIYSEEHIPAAKAVFTPLHPGQIYIAENQYGEVDTVFRKDRIEAKKLVERFGENNLSDPIRKAYENEPYKRFPIVHACFPRKKRQPGKRDKNTKPLAPTSLDISERRVISESGYDMLPYAVWRYRKASHETYGRSPAMFALADIMGLHKISKNLLGAGELAVRPAYNVPAELEGKVDIRPGGFNYFGEGKEGHRRLVTPVQTGINFPIGVDRENTKREIIEKHFHVDFFLMLARAPRQMTATEIIERQGEKAALLGTAVGRLNSECLNPLMDRMFWIEYSAGRLPEIPPILQEYGGGHIGVDYLGALAQAQKRLFQTRGITHGLAALQPLVELYGQKPLDIVDPEEAAREILEANGFPQRAIRTREQLQELEAARAEMAKAEAMKQETLQGVEALKTLAEADRATDGQLTAGLAAALNPEGGAAA